jgi:1,4-alpha-glucan branching enzyme
MLVEAAHRSNIRVILDGVFNHCGGVFLPLPMFWKMNPIPHTWTGFT